MFGDRLKALRNEKDMTQQQMVDAIIARLIERGYSKEDAALMHRPQNLRFQFMVIIRQLAT